MFVKFTSSKGDTLHVNAACVEFVDQINNRADTCLNFAPSGDGEPRYFVVQGSVEDTVAALNEGLARLRPAREA